jgi:hypothetical protein
MVNRQECGSRQALDHHFGQTSCLYHYERKICCVRKNGERFKEGEDTTSGCGEDKRK